MESLVCRLHTVRQLRIETEKVPDPGKNEIRVALGAGGICGSDLHYYHDGGIGRIRVREPIIVGHEAAGWVEQIGAGVIGYVPGDLIAINPSLPCHECKFCHLNEFNHCIDMRFMGSAYRMPHEQGMFRQFINIPVQRACRFTHSVPVKEAACAEPLAVCLHAAAQAPDIAGLRVMITGAGPIGALMTAVVSNAGPAELVITDILDYPLSVAKKMGAGTTINVAAERTYRNRYCQEKGHFDVIFECSGVATAIRDALDMLKPQGTLIFVGLAGEIPLALDLVVGKELNLIGTYRFHSEFADAVHLISAREIDLSPIISRSFAIEDAQHAFELAADRSRAVKVHLTFGNDAFQIPSSNEDHREFSEFC